MMSPRTANFVETMIRDGDEFDYRRWLRRVREEEAEAKEIPSAFSSGESVALEMGDLTDTPELDSRVNSGSALQANSTPRAVYRSGQKARGDSSEDRLRRRLIKVSDAWDDFQECRERDAVFKYLGAVFKVVEHYKLRRETNRLLRGAFKFAGLKFNENAEPFAALVHCTSEHRVDSKTVSKWARALRYVAYCKVPRTGLKTFMKKMGGINGCADRHTRYLGRGSR